MRDEALFIAKPFCNIRGTIGLIHEKMYNIPPRLITKGFKEKSMWFTETNLFHSMNYSSYLKETQVHFVHNIKTALKGAMRQEAIFYIIQFSMMHKPD